jgi:hypothetical protein
MPPGTPRSIRHADVLQRWPVLGEAWAQAVERRRTVPSGPVAGPGTEGITPLAAINRALGLPDDHGADAIPGPGGAQQGWARTPGG